MLKTRNTFQVRADLVAITGRHSLAALLTQIIFWYEPSGKEFKTKLKAYDSFGYLGIQKTRHQFMEETGLSDEQVKTGFKKLREMGFISTSLKKFNGLTMNHVRLLRIDLCKGWNSQHTIPLGYNTPHIGVKHTTLITENTTENTYIKTSEQSTFAEKQEKDPEQIQKQAGDMNSKQILENIEKKKKEKLEKAKSDGLTNGLAIFWKERCAVITGEWQTEPTLKEKGQLKLLGKSLGADTKKVIDFAITNWSKFTAIAKANSGLFNAPALPEVGFLLKHHATAMNMHLQSIAKPKVVPIADNMDATILEMPKKEQKASKEEMEQILKDLG